MSFEAPRCRDDTRVFFDEGGVSEELLVDAIDPLTSVAVTRPQDRASFSAIVRASGITIVADEERPITIAGQIGRLAAFAL
jgi:hypothetical protein